MSASRRDLIIGHQRSGRGDNDDVRIQPAGFVQQGQVDWVAFGNSIYSASVATIQRLASAGVQPPTHAAGLALACQFRLSDLGQRRMDEALQNLKSFPGFEGILHFGFGIQSFVRLLGETQHGINCIALCSCLVDAHDAGTAAGVLKELWHVLEFPEEYEPAYAQFYALVKACSGVVSASTFGSTMSIMLGDLRSRNGQLPIISGPKGIAKVLDGLFKLSKGLSMFTSLCISSSLTSSLL